METAGTGGTQSHVSVREESLPQVEFYLVVTHWPHNYSVKDADG